MKAITIWQPWASLIAMGHKTIETRTHDRFKSLVGLRIAIHAGKRFDRTALPVIRSVRDMLPRYRANRLCGFHCPTAAELDRAWDERGMILATAFVTQLKSLTWDSDVKAAMCDPRGLYGLVLTDIEPLDPPIKARGRQGIWEWDERSIL